MFLVFFVYVRADDDTCFVFIFYTSLDNSNIQIEMEATVTSLEKQLSDAKSREVSLSARFTESVQQVEDLTRRLSLRESANSHRPTDPVHHQGNLILTFLTHIVVRD
jgi:hypothetical protein